MIDVSHSCDVQLCAWMLAETSTSIATAAVTSTCVTVELSLPSVGLVFDGPVANADAAYFASSGAIYATWTGFGATSDVVGYAVAVRGT